MASTLSSAWLSRAHRRHRSVKRARLAPRAPPEDQPDQADQDQRRAERRRPADPGRQARPRPGQRQRIADAPIQPSASRISRPGEDAARRRPALAARLDLLDAASRRLGRGLPRRLARSTRLAALRLRARRALPPCSWPALYHYGPDMKRPVNSVRLIAAHGLRSRSIERLARRRRRQRPRADGGAQVRLHRQRRAPARPARPLALRRQLGDRRRPPQEHRRQLRRRRPDRARRRGAGRRARRSGRAPQDRRRARRIRSSAEPNRFATPPAPLTVRRQAEG